VGQITQWSYSRWNTYEECPKQAYYKFVEKRKEGVESPAMVRGREIDGKATAYIRGEAKVLAPELKLLRDEFKALRKSKATAQLEWAFTRSWDPTGWFDRDCWSRVKTDYWVAGSIESASNSKVIDLKTGKIRDYDEQMELYALAGLIMSSAPVDVEIYFSDHGHVMKPKHGTYHQDEKKALQKTWEKRVKRMLTDTRFDATPSRETCRFCPFRQSAGGPCEKEIR
jgi:CRISPR/Cas system-associated exonuclease Cas4 (RecB family)